MWPVRRASDVVFSVFWDDSFVICRLRRMCYVFRVHRDDGESTADDVQARVARSSPGTCPRVFSVWIPCQAIYSRLKRLLSVGFGSALHSASGLFSLFSRRDSQ